MESGLTREQRQELHRQALLQAEANLENARLNYLLAEAARDALLRDGQAGALLPSRAGEE